MYYLCRYSVLRHSLSLNNAETSEGNYSRQNKRKVHFKKCWITLNYELLENDDVPSGEVSEARPQVCSFIKIWIHVSCYFQFLKQIIINIFFYFVQKKAFHLMRDRPCTLCGFGQTHGTPSVDSESRGTSMCTRR